MFFFLIAICINGNIYETKNLIKRYTVNKAQQENSEEPTSKKKGKLKEFFSSTPDFGKS